MFPGLAVARELESRRRISLAWIGSTNGIERGIVTRAGLTFHGIAAGKMRRYLSFRNVSDVFAVIAGLFQAIGIMRKTRPALLFSKGGYAAVPPAIAGWLTGVPVVTHESDADPGLATRIIARFAKNVLVPYEASAAGFPERIRQRVVVTGNPIRADVLRGSRESGIRAAGFDMHDRRPVLLFLGGSLGARQINELVAALAPRLVESWRVVHQTGDRADDIDLPVNSAGYFRKPFFESELPDILASADLVVCRAGASSLWEAAAMSKAMVLIPLTAGSRGDQIRNARIFEEGGAAVVLSGSAIGEEDVVRLLEGLATDVQRREEMGRNARKLIHIDSTDRIVTILEHLMDTNGPQSRRVREE